MAGVFFDPSTGTTHVENRCSRIDSAYGSMLAMVMVAVFVHYVRQVSLFCRLCQHAMREQIRRLAIVPRRQRANAPGKNTQLIFYAFLPSDKSLAL